MKQLCIVLMFICCARKSTGQNCAVICNGSFDNPFLTGSVGLYTVVNCWSTMATDGKFEIWGTGFGGVNSYQGSQFMELNATQGATVFQDFNVGNGVPLTVKFAHRGRNGMDSMEVFIGPVGGPYTSLGRYGDGNTAWGYYTAGFITGAAGMYRLMFDPVYWTGGNIAIGNFLDAVSVDAGAAISLNVDSAKVCKGDTVSLLASGATGYTWTNGPAAALYTVVPQASTVYTVTATNSLGCPGTATVAVTVNPLPQINVSATKTLLCKDDKPAVITATGGVKYQWNVGPITATISSGPVTATYIVVGTGTNGCKSTASIVITVRLCEDVGEGVPLSQLHVYPNPSRGKINLHAVTGVRMHLIDASGQSVMDIEPDASGARTVVIEDLAPGVYYLTGDGLAGAKKIIVY